MAVEFYGIERAEREGWLLMEEPPPNNVKYALRDNYLLQQHRIRSFGAVVVGYKTMPGDSRSWVFGLPPGIPDKKQLDRLRILAFRAGMLLPPTDPNFTFQWKYSKERHAADAVAIQAEFLVLELQSLTTCTNFTERKKRIRGKIRKWIDAREGLLNRRPVAVAR